MGSFRGVGSLGRGARIGWWITIVGLLAGGAVGAATVGPDYGAAATAAEVERLRGATKALDAEQQLRGEVSESFGPATTKATCLTIRPVTRCEQTEPASLAHTSVTTAEGLFLAVPEARRSASEGKEWVHLAEGASIPKPDREARLLATVKTATIRRNESVNGVAATYFRFASPAQGVPGRAGNQAMTVSMALEAWLDEANRPLRIVQKTKVVAGSRTMTGKATVDYVYGAVEPFAVPVQADALSVPNMDAMNRIALGR